MLDHSSSPRFDLIANSCVSTDSATSGPLSWVALDSNINGATETTSFDFQDLYNNSGIYKRPLHKHLVKVFSACSRDRIEHADDRLRFG